MKKIIVFILLLFSSFLIWNSISYAECDFNVWDSIQWKLNDCFEWKDAKSNLVTVSDDWSFENLNIARWFKEVMQWWVQTLGSVLAILAVGAIVYGSLLLVLSGWEEEKLKKWKDVVKWSMLGFLWVIFAGVLITIVVNVMFSL